MPIPNAVIAHMWTTDEESTIQFFVEAAKRLGVDVTEEEIRKTAEEFAEKQKSETEEAASEVEALSLDDLDMAAGVADSPNCQDTFLQRENCFFKDGCDQTLIGYPDYDCQHNLHGHVCSTKEMFDCSKCIF